VAKAREAKVLEDSIFKATQDIIDAIRSRRTHLASLSTEAEAVESDLRRAVEEIDDDADLQWASKKLYFYRSEDTHEGEIKEKLERLEAEWEEVRAKVDEGKKAPVGPKWWFW
jgi:hypothetical protein